jgi:hypothetical protein
MMVARQAGIGLSLSDDRCGGSAGLDLVSPDFPFNLPSSPERQAPNGQHTTLPTAWGQWIAMVNWSDAIHRH